MGAVFVRRDGKCSNYFVDDYESVLDVNIIIQLLEKLDYPFIAREWYEMDNPSISKYIKEMKLAAYKSFGFMDSKNFNTDEIYNTLLKQEVREEIYEQVVKTKNDNKHLKGYMFDSLVYRFKDYQAKAFQMEVIDYKYKRNCSDLEARRFVSERHTRDLVRFIEILDEAIGEHD